MHLGNPANMFYRCFGMNGIVQIEEKMSLNPIFSSKTTNYCVILFFFFFLNISWWIDL
jgi:hypothetical protein